MKNCKKHLNVKKIRDALPVNTPHTMATIGSTWRMRRVRYFSGETCFATD